VDVQAHPPRRAESFMVSMTFSGILGRRQQVREIHARHTQVEHVAAWKVHEKGIEALEDWLGRVFDPLVKHYYDPTAKDEAEEDELAHGAKALLNLKWSQAAYPHGEIDETRNRPVSTIVEFALIHGNPKIISVDPVGQTRAEIVQERQRVGRQKRMRT